MDKKAHYGLGTAVSMIIGICIGSGIFFKADDILTYTGGNVSLSVIAFVIAALCIIFGSITLTELASRTERTGGLVGYYEEFISSPAASAFGWFQVFVYYPTLIAIVSWVAGIYTTILFQLPPTLEMQVLLGVGYLLFFFLLNYMSIRLGGYFQNLSTIMKLIPLLGIAAIGVFWSAPLPVVPAGTEVPLTDVGFGWIAALAPLAFSFDGWVISTSITHEVKNPRRTMPLALTIGPLLVLAVYVAYFVGMVAIVGPEYILATGDNAIYEVGRSLLGDNGGNIILTFILIAVLGVVNGIVLGFLRLPQSLASKNMLPNSAALARMDLKRQLSPGSALLSLGIVLTWMLLHYLTQKSAILGGGDISEIAIVFSYLAYIPLYSEVIKLRKNRLIEKSIFNTLFPVLGILGSLIIIVGGIVSNPVYVPIFLVFCSLVCAVGYRYYAQKTA